MVFFMKVPNHQYMNKRLMQTLYETPDPPLEIKLHLPAGSIGIDQHNRSFFTNGVDRIRLDLVQRRIKVRLSAP
jgi:hypothetical protein